MYEVTYERNGIYHSNLVKTEGNEEIIKKWFAENKPTVTICGIRIATSDSYKPGKPVITI